MSGDWRTVRLGDVLVECRERVRVEPAASYPAAGVKIAGGGLFWREVLSGSETKYDTLYRLREGQLVYRKLTAWEGPITVVTPEFDGAYVSSEFPTFTLDHSELLPEYLRLVCELPSLHDDMKALSSGTAERRNRLAPSDLLKIEIDLPPIAEQRRIVAALDTVDSAFDAHARYERRLGTAFKAAATELFAEMDAPDFRLGDVAKLRSGGTPSRKESGNFGGDIPWVKTGEVRFNYLDDTEEHITARGLASSSAKLLPPGTVLLAMYGQGATRGRCALLLREMATNQACAAILPSERLVPEYVFFFLWSRYEAIRMESEGSAQDNLNQGMVADMELPIPTREEQERVVERLRSLRAAAEAESRQVVALGRFRATFMEELLAGAQPV